MIKRPFFGFRKPKLKYTVLEGRDQSALKEIPLPPQVTLFLKQPDVRSDNLILKVGERVRTGQTLRLTKKTENYAISTVTGTISGITEHTGYLGQTYPAISIDAAEKDQWDDEFSEAGKTPTPGQALQFLASLPGAPDFGASLSAQHPLDTLIINGIDKDLLIAANEFIIRAEIENLIEGIEHLKKLTPASRIILTVPPGLASQAEKTEAELKIINPVYPDTLPNIIVKNVLGTIPPSGSRWEDMGVAFINAEAVAALTCAHEEGHPPVDKIVTVINKDCSTINVRARMGTPVGHILSALNIETSHGDRLVEGGPMTGKAIYSEDWPISADTDALMVQDREEIPGSSDTHCINCGECVRACPAKVPVNMLIRLLENGLYEEAAEQYNLFSCIECGFCSYVCVARIPLFHYIMLGKHEFARRDIAEESDA